MLTLLSAKYFVLKLVFSGNGRIKQCHHTALKKNTVNLIIKLLKEAKAKLCVTSPFLKRHVYSQFQACRGERNKVQFPLEVKN